jgi:hypothetical protein
MSKLEKFDWTEITNLTKIEDEKLLKQLMDRERAGQNRKRLVMRIYSRYAKVRRTREEREIMGK